MRGKGVDGVRVRVCARGGCEGVVAVVAVGRDGAVVGWGGWAVVVVVVGGEGRKGGGCCGWRKRRVCLCARCFFSFVMLVCVRLLFAFLFSFWFFVFDIVRCHLHWLLPLFFALAYSFLRVHL